MNKVILIGRLTADPEIRYTQGPTPLSIAKYRLAVDRRFKREGEQEADFIPVVAFGKAAEFAEKYFRKGMKVAVTGRLQTGSYKDKDGKTVWTTDVIAEDQEFVESKKSTEEEKPAEDQDGFMSIPDTLDESLPFS